MKLWEAAQKGLYEEAVRLVGEGADVEESGERGISPLNWAAGHGHIEIVQLLIDNGASVDNGQLHAAAEGGHVEVMRLLVERGADVNMELFGMVRPLHLAANFDHLEAMEWLLNHGASPNTSAELEGPPLTIAIRNGSIEGIRLLFRFGASANGSGEKGIAPLHVATLKERLDIVHLLLENGASAHVLDGDEETPLHFAASKGSVEIASVLLEHGARVNAANEKGIISQMFRSIGRSRTAPYSGATPLHCAVENGHVEMLRLLLEHKAQVNLGNENGETPLHRAAQKNHVDCVRLLIDSGGDLCFCNNKNEIPLDLATSEAVQSLLRPPSKEEAIVGTLTQSIKGLSMMSIKIVQDLVERYSEYQDRVPALKSIAAGILDVRLVARIAHSWSQVYKELVAEEITSTDGLPRFSPILAEFVALWRAVNSHNASISKAIERCLAKTDDIAAKQKWEATKNFFEKAQATCETLVSFCSDPSSVDILTTLEEIEKDLGSETHFAPTIQPLRWFHRNLMH